MIVGLLTTEQKDQLIGQQYMQDNYFNPIQDIDGNWIISIEEIGQNTNQDLSFVKELPLIEFNPL